MKAFAEQMFFGAIIELISLVLSYIFKDKPRRAIVIFAMGTIIAGYIAFSPFVFAIPLSPNTPTVDSPVNIETTDILSPLPTSMENQPITEIVTTAPMVESTNNIQLPNIPLYDSFDSKSLDLDKWTEPPWGNPSSDLPIQVDGNLVLTIRTKDTLTWFDWAAQPLGHNFQEIAILAYLENTKDGALGVGIENSLEQKLAIHLHTEGSSVVLVDKKGYKYFRPQNGCCSSYHLFHMKSDGKNVELFFDNESLGTYSMNGFPYYFGIQVLGTTDTTAKVDSVWIKYAP